MNESVKLAKLVDNFLVELASTIIVMRFGGNVDLGERLSDRPFDFSLQSLLLGHLQSKLPSGLLLLGLRLSLLLPR